MWLLGVGGVYCICSAAAIDQYSYSCSWHADWGGQLKHVVDATAGHHISISQQGHHSAVALEPARHLSACDECWQRYGLQSAT